jgi:hypothetical protein
MHLFQIPMVATDLASNAPVIWESVPDSVGTQLGIQEGAVDFGDSGVHFPNNAMITIGASGTAVIYVRAAAACGVTQLTIAPATDDLWNAGNERYNSGVVATDGGHQPACSTCHGATATNIAYRGNIHTPQQIGGVSDGDLAATFTNATVPPGTVYDDSVVPYDVWLTFHKWEMSAKESEGVVVYLRSLAPAPQTPSTIDTPRDQ